MLYNTDIRYHSVLIKHASLTSLSVNFINVSKAKIELHAAHSITLVSYTNVFIPV